MKIPSPSRLRGEEGISGPEPLTLNLGWLLYGEELDILERVHVIIENGKIAYIGNGWSETGLTIEDGVAIPYPLNMHTHILDSIAPEACSNYSLPGYAGSKGLKHAIIRLGKKDLLKSMEWVINKTMYASGIVDYTEDYDFCSYLEQAFSKKGLAYYGLSRPKQNTPEDYLKAARKCHGIGIANPLKLYPWEKEVLSKISREKIVSAHISETKNMARKGDLYYLTSHGVKPAHIVHGTFLDRRDLKYLVDENIVLIVCPRSNLLFTGKLPPTGEAYEIGVDIAVGTDNIGCIEPDIWRELEIAFMQVISRNRAIRSKEFFASFIGASYKALKEKPLFINENSPARILIIDGKQIGFNRSFDKVATLIKRVAIKDYILSVTAKTIQVFDRNKIIKQHK